MELQSKAVRKNLPPGPFWAEDGQAAVATQRVQLPGVSAAGAAAAVGPVAAVEGGSPSASGGEGVASFVSPQSSKLSGEQWLFALAADTLLKACFWT